MPATSHAHRSGARHQTPKDRRLDARSSPVRRRHHRRHNRRRARRRRLESTGGRGWAAAQQQRAAWVPGPGRCPPAARKLRARSQSDRHVTRGRGDEGLGLAHSIAVKLVLCVGWELPHGELRLFSFSFSLRFRPSVQAGSVRTTGGFSAENRATSPMHSSDAEPRGRVLAFGYGSYTHLLTFAAAFLAACFSFSYNRRVSCV